MAEAISGTGYAAGTISDTRQDTTLFNKLAPRAHVACAATAGRVVGTGARIGTSGIAKTVGTTGARTVTLFHSGPFTMALTCTTTSLITEAVISGSSTQAGSVINRHLIATANTPTTALDTDPYSVPSFRQDNTIDFEAPNGANAIVNGVVGTKSLGTDFWANVAGIK
jgi:hypothetical protein